MAYSFAQKCQPVEPSLDSLPHGISSILSIINENPHFTTVPLNCRSVYAAVSNLGGGATIKAIYLKTIPGVAGAPKAVFHLIRTNNGTAGEAPNHALRVFNTAQVSTRSTSTSTKVPEALLNWAATFPGGTFCSTA